MGKFALGSLLAVSTLSGGSILASMPGLDVIGSYVRRALAIK